MIICDVCHEGAKYQYVRVNGKNVCMDCAVTKTIDEMLDELDLKYEDVPEEIEAEYTVMDEASSYPSRMEIPEEMPEDGPMCEGNTTPEDCKTCGHPDCPNSAAYKKNAESLKGENDVPPLEDFLMSVGEVVYTPEAAEKLGIEIDENGHSVKN